LINHRGEKFKLQPPKGDRLPRKGYDKGRNFYLPPPVDGTNVRIEISPSSKRLQILEPFPPWDGKDFIDMPILIKVHGKCTTDHISAAGPWLKYKGHLENLCENTLIGAMNADSMKVNQTINQITGKEGTIPEVAKQYKRSNVSWIVIADENYGEGSAREHAALQPRYLGCKAIISRSFARIHETNLKKQGILPLTFVHHEDYDRISGSDRISILGLSSLSPTGKPLQIQVKKKNGEVFQIPVLHTLNETQIQWFKAGSALNSIAQNQ
jgi:aconitate hydratase